MSNLGRMLEPLSKKNQALLLTLLTYGGTNWEQLLAFLPEELHPLLHEKSEKLTDIPLEKRVPLCIRELRQLVKFRPMVGLEGVDPSWLVAGFQGESPRTIAVTLMHMPSSVSNQIVAGLPKEIQSAMPSRRELSQLPMNVLKRVRRQFHDKFAHMPIWKESSDFGFEDLVMLQNQELILLVRQMGIHELACQLSSMGRRALAQFLRQQPGQLADEMMTAIRSVRPEDLIDEKNAQAFLKRNLAQRSNMEELCQKSGLYRLARALIPMNRIFVQQVAQRFPRAHGRLLMEFVRHISDESLHDSQENLQRVRDQMVDLCLELARRGKLNAALVEKRPRHEVPHEPKEP